MIEKSVFMLKPEGMKYKEEIMSTIEKAGIPIKEWRNLTLDEKHLRKLYPNVSGEGWRKVQKHLLNKEVLVAIVEGEDVINKLYKTCGEETKIFMCAPSSIRQKFKDIAHDSYGNIIHRAKNQKEAEEHIMLFFPPERT